MTDVADPATDRLPRGSILGTRVLRSEDPAFLTQGAVYTDDLVDERLTGAVRVPFVRSPVAQARIVAAAAARGRGAASCPSAPGRRGRRPAWSPCSPPRTSPGRRRSSR